MNLLNGSKKENGEQKCKSSEYTTRYNFHKRYLNIFAKYVTNPSRFFKSMTAYLNADHYGCVVKKIWVIDALKLLF